jgi:Ca2+-binding EF-hand superfamily protein
MLKRLDENGNGMIDPNESQGRARFFLERMASEVPQLDLNRPIPIDKLASALERLREQRMRGGESEDRGGGRGSSSSSAPAIEPLVPGFGTTDILPPPPGFGAEGEIYAVKTTDEDLREANDRIQRYDQNRDGILDGREIAEGRWSDDPKTYDRNHDGRLTASELAVRYALRRTGQNPAAAKGAAPPPLALGSSGGSSAATDPRVEGMVRGILERYDANKNGKFEKEEWSGFRVDPSPADKNKDNVITKDELAAWMGDRFRNPEGDRGGDRGGDRRREGGEGDRNFYAARNDGNASGQSSNANGSKSYRFKTAAERLPEGLPEWFARNDANADGQVAMAEFSTTWSDAVVADFFKFDIDSDGIITPRECLKANEDGVTRGSTVAAAPGAPAPPPSAAQPGGPTAGATASSTPPPGGIDSKYLKYAQGQVKKYDRNGDGALAPDEWSSMSSDPQAADSDGNKSISVEELAIWYTKR